MTPQLIKAGSKGLACCNECRDKVEYLKRIAAVSPEYQQQVDELESKLDHLELQCQAILELGSKKNG